MSKNRSEATLVAMLVVMGLLGTSVSAWAGCFSAVTETARPTACNGAGTSSIWDPDPVKSCRGSLNPVSGCTETNVPSLIRQCTWNNQDCTGGIISCGSWTQERDTGNNLVETTTAAAYTCGF